MRTWNVAWETTARLLLGIEQCPVVGVLKGNLDPMQDSLVSRCGAPYPGALVELGLGFEDQYVAQDGGALIAFFVRHGLIQARLGRELLNEYTLRLAGG